jgi:hypothetical protein
MKQRMDGVGGVGGGVLLSRFETVMRLAVTQGSQLTLYYFLSLVLS